MLSSPSHIKIDKSTQRLRCSPQSNPEYDLQDYNTYTREPRLPFLKLFPPNQTDVDLLKREEPQTPEGMDRLSTANTGFKRFPFDNFTYYLTLFSKFFSSFPHGTCSLSVSRRYLALDGIYHPIWAAFPNNPTL
jgi:hypothetical protein